MPPGRPVAAVAIEGAVNAGLLAIQMLAISDETLRMKLKDYKEDMAKTVREKDQALQAKYC